MNNQDIIHNLEYIKEQIKSIINLNRQILDNLINFMENQKDTRKIIKEELTNLWNISEIPALKIIIEKLDIMISKNKETQPIKIEEKKLVPINAWNIGIEPIIMDISKMKPQLTEKQEECLNNLKRLRDEGKF